MLIQTEVLSVVTVERDTKARCLNAQATGSEVISVMGMALWLIGDTVDECQM